MSALLNAASEIQLETSSRKSIMNTRTKLRVDFWNVRTVYETWKQVLNVLREMKENKLHISGISECRWLDFEQKYNKYRRNNSHHHEGLAIVLSKTTAKSLVKHRPVNIRVIRVQLSTNPVKTSTIQAYAPTKESENGVEQDFYESERFKCESWQQQCRI